MALPINIEDLLSAKTVESNRIEFKEGWNPDAIYRTMCAFANDFDNTGGGYILIGVAEKNGTAQRPVKGLKNSLIAEIQRKMIGFNNLINPAYSPKLFIETVDKKQIIVLWIPGGPNRPYEAPEQVTATNKRYFPYIRRYANSIKANVRERHELIGLANQVPFDDRPNPMSSLNDISMMRVKEYLFKIKSRMAGEVGKRSDREVLEQMELLSGTNENIFPRNVALMLFSEDPARFFPQTQVDIVYFPHGEAEPFTEYPKISGTVPEQINKTLDFFKTNVLKESVIKPRNRPESTRIWNYPLQAIEEILVNAFYHRDYQVREPIEIRIYANSIIFINHGGPDRSIKIEAFENGKAWARRYRNRRLGDFLKELELTEGRATGIPTVLKVLKENGSPPPRFNTDDDRTFFEVEIFIHPAFHNLPVHPKEVVNDSILDIDARLNEWIATAPEQAAAIAGAVGSAIAGAQVSAIAGAIAEHLNNRTIKVLKKCKNPVDRAVLMKHLKISNHRKNFEEHVKPLINLGWIAMTIPAKPTSPNQQYKTTLKGRIIIELLKYER